MTVRAVSPRALLTLLAVAFMFGGNHVAARAAFNHGVDVATAVTLRSVVTAIVIGALLALQRRPLSTTPRQRAMLLLIGVLVAVQSLALYSAVARLPVALALMTFNTFPIWTALWARVLFAHRPDRRTLLVMPVILVGLALALDVAGAASGLSLQAQWQHIGSGVGFALAAALAFGLVLVLTQHEVASLDGRWRSAISMAVVGLLAGAATAALGGPHWPDAPAGWWGLALLTVLYGTAFTIVFTLLPTLGVVGNSPILNIEPVAAMVMAWLLLGQRMAAVQVLGAAVVVAAVMTLGLRRH